MLQLEYSLVTMDKYFMNCFNLKAKPDFRKNGEKFSKFTSLLNFLYKMTIKLTFENFFCASEPSSNQNRNRSHSLFFKCIYVTPNFEKKNALIYICSHFTYIKFITFIYVTQNVERKKNKTMSRTFFLFSKSLTIFKCAYFTQNF